MEHRVHRVHDAREFGLETERGDELPGRSNERERGRHDRTSDEADLLNRLG